MLLLLRLRPELLQREWRLAAPSHGTRHELLPASLDNNSDRRQTLEVEMVLLQIDRHAAVADPEVHSPAMVSDRQARFDQPTLDGDPPLHEQIGRAHV